MTPPTPSPPGARDLTSGIVPVAGTTPVSPPVGAAPLSFEAIDLLAVLRRASAYTPIPQLVAGRKIGLTGKPETVRRRVQHLRDEITAKTGQVVCSTWACPPGMWLPGSAKEEDAYIGRVLARAYTTIGQFRGLEREKRLRIAEEIQGLLNLESETIGTQHTPLRVAGKCCPQCGIANPMRRSDQIYCSAECRYDTARKRGSI